MYLRLLGEVAVRGADDEWLSAGPAKRSAVLAVLALSAGNRVTQDQLVDRVWGDEAPAAVRSALYSHITRLRRLLAPWPARIDRAGGGYRLDADDDAVDLFVMRELVLRGTALSASGDHAEAVSVLRQAEHLWHEQPMSNIESRWVDRIRLGLRRERVGLAEARFDAELACGTHTEILDELHAAAQAYPESEHLTAQLMLALYRSGRQSQALEHYQHTLGRLREDFGLEPGRDLRELHRKILRHDAGLQPGQAPQPAPPPKQGPRQLPPVPGGFVDRAEPDTALDALLAAAGDGGVTPIGLVTGMAGVGKTATTLRWAHRNAGAFPGGQLYADLGGFGGTEPRPTAEILAGFLLALGARGDDIPIEPSAREAAYRSRSAGRRLLVVLDNAATAERVRPLVPAGSGSLVLVTSRNRLSGLIAVDGAHPVRLDLMDAATAERVLVRQLGEPRARAEAEAVAELAKVCGGLPLALRIAAANLIDHPEQSIGELVRELSGGDRLDALAVPDDAGAAVRTAFSHSLNRLDDFTATVFATMGLVPGPSVPAPAIAAMLSDATPRVTAALRELTAAHLAHPVGRRGFGQHDLLKEYARGQADAATRDERLQRLFGWYVRAARAASETISATSTQLPTTAAATPLDLPEPADPAEATDWFESEYDNLMTLVQVAAEQRHPAAWLLAEAMRLYLARKVDYPSWLAAARAGLAAATARDDAQARAAMHYQVALHAKITGDFRTGAEQLGLALTAAEAAGDRLQTATVHASLADMHHRHGRLSQAIEHCSRVLALEPLPQRQMMIALNVLGFASRERGDLDQARAALERNVELLRGGGDHKLVPTLENLAVTYLDMGEYERALSTAEEVTELAQGSAVVDLASARKTLALVRAALGDLDRAKALARDAVDLLADPAVRLFRPPVLAVLARCEHDDPQQAVAYAREAAALAEELLLPWSHTEAELAVAETRLRTGELDAAETAATATLRRAESHGYALLRGQALAVQAEVHAAHGRTGAAVANLREAARVHREAGHHPHLSKVEARIATLTEPDG